MEAKSGQHVPRPRGEKEHGVLKEPRTPCLASPPYSLRHKMGNGWAPGKPSFGSSAVRQSDLSLRKSLFGPQKASEQSSGARSMEGLLGFAIRRRTRLHLRTQRLGALVSSSVKWG